MINLDILISALVAIVVALSALPGMASNTQPIARLTRKLRDRWRQDMDFYHYWLRLKQPRSEAWEKAQRVIG